jgi:hypothetical protein
MVAASGSLTSGMRAVVIVIALVTLAGCGDDAKPAAQPKPAAERAEAPEVVFLYRVQGDDPLPDSVSVRADGRADVRRGGGHGGFRTVEVALSDAVAARATRLAEHAPWKKLEGRTVKPGGFGGWDNDMRYMLRRGQQSITVTADHLPRSIAPLIAQLNAIIEGDTGKQLSSELHSAVSGTIAP